MISTKLFATILLISTFIGVQPCLSLDSMYSPSNNFILVSEKVPSPSLQNAILGSTSEQPYLIILPESYSSSSKKYPVIYFLHGFATKMYTCRSLKISEQGPIEMILVFISGHNDVIGGSFYTNSPITGNWEDFVVMDIVNYTDSTYRTIRDPKFRGIAGFSMGGYGAWNIAMKHPDIFGSVFLISPGLFNQNGLNETNMITTDIINFVINTQTKLANSSNRTIAQIEYVKLLNTLSDDDNRRLTLAYGSAFAANSTRWAPYIDYPFHNISGTINLDSSVWDQWQNGFGGLAKEIQAYENNLKKLNGIGIEFGEQDSYVWIPKGCRYLSDKLDDKNITHQLINTSFGHGDEFITRFSLYLLPFFSEIFGSLIQTSTERSSIIILTWMVVSTFVLIILLKKRH